MTAVVGLVCCPKDCCDVALQDGPEYIDVTVTRTVITVARACNQPPSGPWVDGQIVSESSMAQTIKTRLRKVLAEGFWHYECPEPGDPNRIRSATISGSSTNYLACFDLESGGVWYGETYNTVTTASFIDQPGCASWLTLNGNGATCVACFTMLAQFPAGSVETAFTCGDCQFPNLDSGSSFNEDAVTIGPFGMCREFSSGSSDFTGPLAYEDPLADICPCPQECPDCFQPEYPGIATCSGFGESFGTIDASVCVSTTYTGVIEEVVSPL